MKFAFLSRHTPTPEQIALAEEQNVELIPIGDKDAFSVVPQDIMAHGDFDGVIVVHPAAALRLQRKYIIGVYQNGNRAPEGERPQFFARDLYLFFGEEQLDA